MDVTKYFIGPMSKNIVDAVVEYSNDNDTSLALIPSRRQVEYNGGYVNHWTTEQFANYVKSKSNKITIQRDHSGPGQGYKQDDGYESLLHDCKYLDLIHIDPWKEFQDYDKGLEYTIDMIKFCNAQNENIRYEVGTEEAIRRFESTELHKLLSDLKARLSNSLFEKIQYVVIQSGTSLKGTLQTGTYDKTRLASMINVVKSFNKLSKEHNGDYILPATIKEKFNLGLDSINIAPEFGVIETMTYMDQIVKHWRFDLLNTFWEICYQSNRWTKWVDSSFDPHINKHELIMICGHYVLSDARFLNEIKANMPGIDDKIKNNIKVKLNELHS